MPWFTTFDGVNFTEGRLSDHTFYNYSRSVSKPADFEITQTANVIREKVGDLFKVKEFNEKSECKIIYGLPKPSLSAVDHLISEIKTEVEDAFYRDFFYIQLKPVKLEKVKSKDAPYFVFKTKPVKYEFTKFIYDSINVLKTQVGKYVSDYVLDRWNEKRSCLAPPYTFMLDNVTQELSHSNEYGYSFLQNLSNFLSQNVSHWIQMFIGEQSAAATSENVINTIMNSGTFKALKQMLQNMGVSENYISGLTEGFRKVATVMATGGRFDSPKVWNSSASNLSLSATIHLVSEISNPDLIATKIVEPLLILWGLSIPRGFDRVISEVDPSLKNLSRYFYIWPYYVEATIYRGNPYSENKIQVLKLPAAAIRGIRTSFSTEGAVYRGESVLALKIQFELDPVYTTVYGTVADSMDESAMMTFNWFIKNTLSNMVKVNYKKSC